MLGRKAEAIEQLTSQLDQSQVALEQCQTRMDTLEPYLGIGQEIHERVADRVIQEVYPGCVVTLLSSGEQTK